MVFYGSLAEATRKAEVFLIHPSAIIKQRCECDFSDFSRCSSRRRRKRMGNMERREAALSEHNDAQTSHRHDRGSEGRDMIKTKAENRNRIKGKLKTKWET